MSRRRAPSRLTLCALAALVYGCAGEGCECLADLEDEFPAAAKQRAGLQVRLTESGLNFLSENAFDMLSGQIGDTLVFDVPADCSSDPTVCCGYPAGYCQMELDLRDYGEGSHFEVESLDQTGNRLGITIYPRVRTLRPMPARTYGPLGGAIDCNVEFNTRFAGTRWMWIYFEVILGENADNGELGVDVTTAQVGGISTNDINIYGDFLCRFGSEQDAIDGIVAGFRSQVPEAIQGFLCETCDTDNPCSAGATCDDGVCRSDATGECRQNFGIAGRHQAGELLGPLLGQALSKKLDIYFAAGAEAISEDSGLSLAVTSGMEPAATPADHNCVPVVPAPPQSTMPLASDLRGNTHPVTGGRYDLGAAIHVDALNRGAWAAHQAGYICLNLGTKRIEMLDTDAMLLVAPSLGGILEEREKQPMFLLIRPQTTPNITLGDGTFVEEGDGPAEIDDPLLKIALADLEMDFYAYIDDRYTRIFTVISDANFGVSLDVDADGGLIPVLDDPGNALSNVRAKNVMLIAETDAEIAERIPSILGVALGGLSSELGSAIELPEVAGLGVSLSSGAFTSIDGRSRLAMFADLAPAQGTERAVETRLAAVQFNRADSSIEVTLDETDSRDLEWQFRIAGGFWSPFTSKASATIRRSGLSASDRHTLEVRARVKGNPATLDRSPATIDVIDEVHRGGVDEQDVIAFHGEGDSAGCGECSSSSGGTLGGALLVLLALCLAFGRRSLHAAARRVRPTLLAALAAMLFPACSCGSDTIDGESDPNDPNQVQPGPIGRWVSGAADGSRVIVASYERSRGDLVISDIREEGEPRYVAIDGVPTGPITKDENGYRGGIEASGDDVGAWNSVAFHDGKVVIAYQDRDRNAIRVAVEVDEGFETVDVQVPTGTEVLGRYATLSVATDGTLGLGYLAVSVATLEDQTEEVTTELRYASASSPLGPWAVETVTSATADHSLRLDMPAGIGLFASLAHTANGPAISHYDSRTGDLLLSSKTSEGWTQLVVDAEGDRGQHTALVADGESLWVVYQDADSDRLLLREVSDGQVGAVEVIDDGRRDGDRNHPVGADATMVVSGDELAVAYQDSAIGVVVVARRPIGGGEWTRNFGETRGAGFGIALATEGGRLWTTSAVYIDGESSLEATRW